MSITTIATHNGAFHADEVMACAILRRLYPDVKIFRTRDKAIYEQCDCVVDVGGEYDPDKNRFDHHQGGLDVTIDGSTPLSSVGMVYKKFWRKFLHSDDEDLCQEFYNNLVREVDAIDNGTAGGSLISSNISRVIAMMNGEHSQEHDEQMRRFTAAMNHADYMMTIVLAASKEALARFKQDYEKMRPIFDAHMESKEPYIVVETHAAAWFRCIDKYYRKSSRPEWVIYKEGDNWRIRTTSRSSKQLAPEDAIRAKVPDLVFAHKGRFIAETKTIESAKAIAALSV